MGAQAIFVNVVMFPAFFFLILLTLPAPGFLKDLFLKLTTWTFDKQVQLPVRAPYPHPPTHSPKADATVFQVRDALALQDLRPPQLVSLRPAADESAGMDRAARRGQGQRPNSNV